MEVKETNFHGIYRTALEQAMRRPTYEPPDIDITGIFDSGAAAEYLEHIEKLIPDPALRCDFLDLWSESLALQEYHMWIFDCGIAAVGCGDGKGEEFYEGLVNAILVDYYVVREEYRPKYEEVLGAKMSDPYDEYRDEIFKFRDDNGVPFDFFRPSSTGEHAGNPQALNADDHQSTSQSENDIASHNDANADDHQSTSQSENDIASHNDANNDDVHVPATPPRPKSSKTCCTIL